MPSLIRVTRRKPPVRTHRESEQTVENHDVSPPVFSALRVLSLSPRLFRYFTTKRSLSPPSPESSECSDVSMRSDLSKDLIINFSRKQKPELSSGSSDSSDQSSKRRCTDFVPDMSLCMEREGKDHLFKLLLIGPHGIRDGLMSSNQDQPQSNPGSFDSCGESVRSDESKGQGINFQGSDPERGVTSPLLVFGGDQWW